MNDLDFSVQQNILHHLGATVQRWIDVNMRYLISRLILAITVNCPCNIDIIKNQCRDTNYTDARCGMSEWV